MLSSRYLWRSMSRISDIAHKLYNYSLEGRNRLYFPIEISLFLKKNLEEWKLSIPILKLYLILKRKIGEDNPT